MDHFNQDHDVVEVLYDVVVGVVARVHHRRAGAAHDEAAVVELIRLRRIPPSDSGASGRQLLRSLPPFGVDWGEASVRWIDDERGAEVAGEGRLAPVEAELGEVVVDVWDCTWRRLPGLA